MIPSAWGVNLISIINSLGLFNEIICQIKTKRLKNFKQIAKSALRGASVIHRKLDSYWWYK